MKMEKKTERRGLGRGLSALMADVSATTGVEAERDAGPSTGKRPDFMVPVELLFPNPDQPRRQFSPDALSDLAESIKKKGILQPLIVRPAPSGTGYEIVAGERRWRAAQLAQIHEAPVILRDYSDTEVLEVAIIENIQRADLNAMEEAAAFRQLMDRFGHTQEQLAEALSKSRSHVANQLRLLNLPDDVQLLVREGKLSAGHARALITAENPSELARMIVAKGLSVREAEKLAKSAAVSSPTKVGAKSPVARTEKDADTRALEGDLSANLKMGVSIQHQAGTEAGVMSIRYNNLDDLDLLCRVLSSIPRDGSI